MKDWTGNYNSIWKIIGASSHTEEKRQQDDYYATDPVAIDKLLTVEKPYPLIWECACGEGHLSKRLQDFGYIVYSTDLVDRGYSTGGGELTFSKQLRSRKGLIIATYLLTHRTNMRKNLYLKRWS